jgi:hypothetical protein
MPTAQFMLSRSGMSSFEQRVAYMEGRMEDHAALFADIRADMRAIRVEMRAELTGLRTDMASECHAMRTEMAAEFRAMRTEMDRRFTWAMGLLVTVLVTVLTGMAGLAYQIARLQSL